MLIGFLTGIINPEGVIRLYIDVSEKAFVEVVSRTESGALARRSFIIHPGMGAIIWSGPRFKKNGSINLAFRAREGTSVSIQRAEVSRPAFRMIKGAESLPLKVLIGSSKQRVTIEYLLERQRGKWTPLRESFWPALAGAAAFALAGAAVVWLCRNIGRIAVQFHSAVRIHPRLAAAGLVAGTLVFAMALSSAPNAHPDERWHYSAAEYFKGAWRLPAIESPACSPSISSYGHSYLWGAEPFYLLCGKFMRGVELLAPGADPVVTARLFQLLLFGIILSGMIVFQRGHLAIGVLCSGQVWYIFSYANGDALPFAASAALLLVVLALRERVNSGKAAVRNEIWLWASAAGLISLILVSKKMYWFVLPPALLLLLMLWICRWKTDRSTAVRIATTVFAAFFTLLGSLKVHEFLRLPSEASLSTWTKNGVEAARGLTEEQQAKLNRTVMLRSKGVGLTEMLFERRWIVLSAASAFGVYGWMGVWQQTWFYYFAWSLLLVLVVKGLAAGIRSGKEVVAVMTVSLGSIAALIAASAWWSWTVDMQPQGRYWLPGFLLLGLCLELARHHLPERSVRWLAFILFVLALYSFSFGGLHRVDGMMNGGLL